MPAFLNDSFRRLRRVWQIAGAVLLVGRRRGFVTLASKLGRSWRDGAGVLGFLLWVRDAAAFERRSSARRYQRWLRRRPTSPGAAGAPAPPAVLRTTRCLDPGSAAPYLFADHPDAVVAPEAEHRLLSVAEASGADVVFADEDELVHGQRRNPFFKPGFSIDLLRASDFIGPVFLLRRAALARVLGASGTEPAGTHELLLRLAESGCRFEHVDEVLVHWGRPRSFEATGGAALQNHLQRCYGSDLASAMSAGRLPAGESRVSIIIPTRDRVDLLSACIESIYGLDAGVPFETIILDNGSRSAATKAWLDAAPERYGGLQVLPADYEFNWSRLNNQGARCASGDLLLFLNNDVEVRGERWLERLAIQALRPDIGCVGPMLLFPDGTIQHAGVVVGLGGFADHLYAGCNPAVELRHLFVHPALPRNVLAVTGACMLVSRASFAGVGGFDERLAICGDIEICVKLHRAQKLNLYEPGVRLLHHESATRLRKPLPEREVTLGKQFLAEYLEHGDPFYNAALSRHQRYPGVDGGPGS